MGKLKATTPPAGLFRGRNIMTPDIQGYYKLRGGGQYAELSKGRGIYNEPIYGVTVRPDGDGAEKKSKLCHSITEALSYIGELS